MTLTFGEQIFNLGKVANIPQHKIVHFKQKFEGKDMTISKTILHGVFAFVRYKKSNHDYLFRF